MPAKPHISMSVPGNYEDQYARKGDVMISELHASWNGTCSSRRRSAHCALCGPSSAALGTKVHVPDCGESCGGNTRHKLLPQRS